MKAYLTSPSTIKHPTMKYSKYQIPPITKLPKISNNTLVTNPYTRALLEPEVSPLCIATCTKEQTEVAPRQLPVPARLT